MKSHAKISVLFLLLSLWACKEEPPKPLDLIAPPIPALDIAYHSYQVDAEKGGSIVYEKTGSQLQIPANAFVDTAGNTVTGMVEVKYREFHDAVDILLSGIPMNYDSAGAEGALTTGGMFEVKAMQGEQELALASGKNLPIRMASFQTGDEYNFYTLNQEARKWEFKGKPTVETNQTKVKWLEKAEKMKPSRKFPYDPKKVFVFNYMSFLDVYFKNNWKEIRQAVKNRGVEKKLAPYGVSLYEMDLDSRTVTYGGTKYPKSFMVWELAGKNFPKWAKPGNVSGSIELVRGDLYKLTISEIESSRASFTTTIRLVMPLQYLLRFSPNYWKNNYEKAMEMAEEETKKAALLAETFRSFEVPSLGIHNYDYFTRDDNFVTLNATFDFGLKKKEGLEIDAIDRVYFVSGDGRTIVRFDQNKWATFKIAHRPDGRLFTILPTQQISLFSAEKYSALPFDQWGKASEGEDPRSYNFIFEPQPQNIESAQDIHKLLGIPAENPKKLM